MGPFGYAQAEVLEKLGQSSVPIRRLMYGEKHLPSLGYIFRLTEDALIAKLEEFIQWLPGYLELRETAGLHQLYSLKPLDPISVLEWHYSAQWLKEAP